jgi:putative oxidoreductase
MNGNDGKSRSGVDWALLILRVGIGLMFVYHGYSKMFGGPAKWAELGGVMGLVGLKFAPVFWGFMAAFAEFFGGIFLVLGLATRLYAFLLLVTMVMASIMHLKSGQGLAVASHPIKMAVVFLSLMCSGPGALSLDVYLRSKLSPR